MTLDTQTGKLTLEIYNRREREKKSPKCQIPYLCPQPFSFNRYVLRACHQFRDIMTICDAFLTHTASSLVG